MTGELQEGATVEVRATINLPGLNRGQVARADPEAPYVRDALAAGYLVLVDEEDDGS